MIKKLILPVSALLAITSCSSDELLQESPNGGEPLMHFNSLVSNNTRAETTETTITESGFWVDAYTPDDNQYYFKDIEWVSKKNNYFYPQNDYYWPGKNLNFVAWYDDRNPNIDGKQYCKIARNNSSIKYDYAMLQDQVTHDCVDFVYALSENVNNPSSFTGHHTLTFKHAYSQILVQAKLSSDCDYTVQVKGVSLRYILAMGNFIMEPKTTTTEGTTTTAWDAYWTMNDNSKHIQITEYKANAYYAFDESTSNNCYGKYNLTYSDSPISLNKTTLQALNGASKTGGGFELKDGFYVIPQEFTASFDADKLMSSQYWNGDENKGTTKHYGAYLTLNVVLTKDGKVIREGNIAVPVFKNATLAKLEKGKRYIINLTFGKDAAGQVPPDEPGPGEEGGEPILGLPIHFDVQVDGWQPTTGTSTTTNIDLPGRTPSEGGNGTGTEGGESTGGNGEDSGE